MSAYGWVITAQTVLALLVLGLAGGWLLWPFREGRPYLWLTSPVAGLAVVGLVLTLSTYCLGVPVGWGLAVTVPVLTLPTLTLLVRGGWRRLVPGLTEVVVLTVAVTAGIVGCTRADFETAEPTLTCGLGSDQWGYIAG